MAEDKNPDLRFQYIEEWMSDQLSNIAQNKGITVSDFLKPILRDIVSKYPVHLKSEIYNTNKKHVRVNAVAKDVAKEFNILVENFGGNPSYFIKMHLYNVIANYPEKYRQKPKDF